MIYSDSDNMVTMSNIRDELKTVNNDKFDTIEVTISMSRETFDRFIKGRLCDIDIIGDDYYNDDETTAEMFLYLG